ncbi:MAG: response regulator [Janthinobacterium lividum]
MSQAQPTRVLVVEDDAITRASITDILEEDGVAVTAVPSGTEFLPLLTAGGEAPQMLMVDVNLGGTMSGFDLARMAHARWPGIAVIYVTGDLRAMVRNDLGPRDLCLLKPFTDEALRRLMQAVG